MRRALGALVLACLLSPVALARADTADHYALLMVWMPGLCKLEPDRAECKELTLRRYDGLNLAFMALQSVRRNSAPNTFCFTMLGDESMDQSRQWCEMSESRLSKPLAEQLRTLMPVMQSCQDRGLWARYASCTLYNANDYYTRAIKLASAAAKTQMNLKIAAAIGKTAKTSELVEAFQADFGDDKGNAVDFICRKIGGRSHLFQVRITLTARALTRGLASEFLWKPAGPLRRSCPENFQVDAPPVPAAGGGAAKEVVPAPPPGEPAAPESMPVGPVDTEPLEPQGPVVR
jgi:ribonuclease I (enterobacter ribonuclease)